MKIAGFLLLLSGWILILAAVMLLDNPLVRAAFVLAGIGVEALGLVLVVRSHLLFRKERG
jgi:purine-cytosine permease-like protein